MTEAKSNEAARSAIMARIRQSLGVTGKETDRRAAVTNRMMRAERGIIPKRGQLPGAERVDMFQAMAEKYAAEVERIAGYDDLPAAVSAYLRQRNLAPEIRRGSDRRLAAAPWHKEPNLEVKRGPSDGNDAAGISHAVGGAAESGTLILISGAENPTTLNFLPDHHVVVVDAKDIAGDYETIWQRIRDQFGKGELPRTVNMVTGPSRSADIGQKLILGAHGPRVLRIVIVGEATD